MEAYQEGHWMPDAKQTVPLDAVRQKLIALLDGGQAHTTLDEVVKDFPPKYRGIVPEKLPYSAWQLLEHMRIAQKDILDFSSPPEGGYKHIKWPDDYWPKENEPVSEEAWDQSVAQIKSDLEAFKALLTKPDVDLVEPFPWGEGQNLLREALLIADHNAYHLGELLVVRRLVVAWHG
jgi:hypothetical protein